MAEYLEVDELIEYGGHQLDLLETILWLMANQQTHVGATHTRSRADVGGLVAQTYVYLIVYSMRQLLKARISN